MQRIPLILVLVLAALPSLAHAHEVELQLSGMGAGPFGISFGAEATERLRLTVGADAYRVQTVYNGVDTLQRGAVVTLGMKLYFRPPPETGFAPFLRLAGGLGAGSASVEGDRRRMTYLNASATVGASYFFQRGFGLGTEVGAGFMQQVVGNDFGVRDLGLVWRLTVVYRFGDEEEPSPTESAQALAAP